MTRLASICVVLIASIPASSHADTGMLPNGAVITWDRLKIVETEGGSPQEPSSPDSLRHFLNLPHCQCAKAGAGFQSSLTYELKMSITTGTSRPGEVWVGSQCDDDTVRAMKCRQLTDQTIDDIDTLAISPRDIDLPIYDLINGVDNQAACQEREGDALAWILVDSNADGTYDYTTQKVVGSGIFTDVTGIDTQPPPLPESFKAESGENAVVVSWDIPEGRAADLFAYQALCIDESGNAVTGSPAAPLYQTTETVCELPQEFVLSSTDLPEDPTEDVITTIPEPFKTLDKRYICGTQTAGTAEGMTIDGLQNGTKYTVAVLAIDYFGNVTGMYFGRTVKPKAVTDLWEDIHDNGGDGLEGGFCSTSGGGDSFLAMIGVLGLVFALRRRRGVVVTLAVLLFVVRSGAARADDFTPYWEDPALEANALAEEEDVSWNAGIRLGPYIPDIDAKLGKNAAGQGPYEAMFGDYVLDGKKIDKHVWQVLPMLDVDRILWKGFGQAGVGGSIGYMQKSALAYTDDSDPSMGTERPRASGSTTKFRLIPLAATATYRLTYLDDEWGIPLVPYLRGGLSYYIWWMVAPSGKTSRICDDGTQTAGCEGNKAKGGTLGYQGSIGLALRAERVDLDAARSMRQSGIYHAGFYGELQYAKVDGFGSDAKLSVGDTTWFAGVNFEF